MIAATVEGVASSNRPSKDKRQRRNRAQREARAARSARAGEATSRVAESSANGAAGPAKSASRPTSKSGSEKAPSGWAARRAASQERMKQRYPIPGQRAVFLSFMFSFVFAAMLLFSTVPITREVPPDDPRVAEAEDVDEPNDDGLVEITENTKLFDEETVPVAATIMLLPIAITGGAVYFTKRKQRSTVWTIALFALTGFVLLSAPYSFLALPSMIAIAVGSFQSRRAENKPRLEALKAEREARQAEKRAAKEGRTVDDDADVQDEEEIIDADVIDED